jgi:hypothetical protein
VWDRKIGSSGVYVSDNVEKLFKTGDDDDLHKQYDLK